MGLIIGILSLAIPYDEIPSCCPASREPSSQPIAQIKTGFPPGLEYLTAVSSIYIKQDVNLMGAVVGFPVNKTYAVMNQMGDRIYIAAESTSSCQRVCLGSTRRFELNIIDAEGTLILQVNRPCRCGLWLCGDCCCNKVEATAASGEKMGHAEIVCACCSIVLHVFSGVGMLIFIIKLVGSACCACGHIKFDILLPDGLTKVGQITKFHARMQEWFTDADNFGAEFPVDLDVRMKTVLLASIFLIDFTYFENDAR